MAITEKTKKRLLIAAGIVAGLFVLVVALVPLLVDVDSYRPQIVEAASKHLNGKLELGKLSLSLWSGVRVRVEGVAVSDTAGAKILSAKDVDLKVSFLSLLAMSPHVTLRLVSPELAVAKDKKGQLNVLKLMKEGSPGAADTPPATAPGTKADEKGSSGGFAQGLVARTRVGLDIQQARVDYTDATTGTKSRFDKLSLVARELSLTRPTTVELTAAVDTEVGTTMRVNGPVILTASGKPELRGGELQSSQIEVALDVSKLAISMPGTFEKKSGVAAKAEATVRYSPEKIDLQSIRVTLHNAELEGKGSVARLDPLPDGARDPIVDLRVESKPIALAPWGELLPAARSYGLSGEARLVAGMKGPVSGKGYFADFSLSGAQLSVPGISVKPKLEAELRVRSDKVERLLVAVSGPGSDMKLDATLTSFTAPKIQASLTSKGFDADVWFPQAPKGKTAGTAAAGAGAVPGKGSSESDSDAMVAPLRQNEMLKSATGVFNVNIARLKSRGAEFRDVGGSARLQRLGLDLDRFGLKAFDGSVTAKGRVDLAPKVPTFSLVMNVAGLNLQKAVESQFAPFKNTIAGIATYDMKINGASFNPERAKASLRGSGKMVVQKAVFNTIDIGKLATDAINQSLSKIEAQMPGVKGLSVKTPGNQKSEYESMTADFEIADGKFRAPNFFAKAVPNRGLDVKGNTTVGLLDDSLDAQWEIIDTYNQTKARDLSVNISGSQVNNILAEGGAPVKLPVKVTGTVFDPKVNYLGVPEALAKVALNNLKRAGEERVKQELKKQAEQQIQKAAPQLENAIKGLFK